MSDKEDLSEWARNVPWEKWIYDKEVELLLTQLRERIATLTSEGVTGDEEESNTSIKLVTVGDGAVGKTSLLISYITNDFPTDYVPTVFENHSKQVKHNATNKDVLLRLWDTAGQEDYDRLRPLSYPGADLILICFSTVSPVSLNMIREKWYPEVKHYAPDVPVILVGTKVDLRSEEAKDGNEGGTYVTEEEGRTVKEKIGAVKYIEVSSKTGFNLDEVFQSAMGVVLDIRRNEERSRSAGRGENVSSDTVESSTTHPRKKSARHQKVCILF
ncbi:rho-related protein racC-like [Schistocerca gregaria]|uniref:rho-related protein racC-like n=1 Tax=Schistocerca gregaria TaxID=7010 RepID=UPI00211E444B|nr:rho-related protein racC-like [Schistocerca gregaria]